MIGNRVGGSLVALVMLAASSWGQTFVKGYFKADGTYVPGHFKSKADGNFWNNWSTYGNVNPYTLNWGTRKYPPLSSSYSPNFGSGYLYGSGTTYRSEGQRDLHLDLELIRAQNEVRLAYMRLEAERRDLERQRRTIENEARMATIQAEINRLQADRDAKQADAIARFGYISPTTAPPPRIGNPIIPKASPAPKPASPPKRLEHDIYIVNGTYTITAPTPVTYSEVVTEFTPLIMAEAYPRHFAEYDLHVKASERALDRRDYATFQRAFSKAKNIVEGRKGSILPKGITFRRIKDARTLQMDGLRSRFGRAVTDAKVRTAPNDSATAFGFTYKGEWLAFVPGPSKDWLKIPFTDGRFGYIRTSYVELSSWGYR